MHNKKGLYDPQLEHDACGFGFVCNVLGERSHKIIEQGLKVLKNLDHRGAVGSEPNSGDGAGILVHLPHDFFTRELKEKKINLPQPGAYAVGQFFFPKNERSRLAIKAEVKQEFKKNGLKIITWREVPTCSEGLGKTALNGEPKIEQIFVENNFSRESEFEQKLYFVRKILEKKIALSSLADKNDFFMASLSSRTIVYKGQLTTSQLDAYFLDLQDKLFHSAFIIIHSRFSTNTFPSWRLAHPFRVIAHNGEINTKRGNVNWMHSRDSFLDSAAFSPKEIKAMQPIINAANSDSLNFDSMLDFLIKSGKNIAEAIMLMIPEAWEHDTSMEEDKKSFYRFYAGFMEPWDGPAAIAFSDGIYVGGTLDRNGLRPSRYTLYRDNTLVMSSEAGVLDLPFSEVKFNKKLEPGKLLIVDLEKKKIISDEEIKKKIVSKFPYSKWNCKIHPLKKLLAQQGKGQDEGKSSKDNEGNEAIKIKTKAFGYSQEDFKKILSTMANKGVEPVGSMGRDIPLAVLSQKPVLLFNYFHQLFAQVTNPPIDPIREKNFMSLKTYLGSQKKLFKLNAKDDFTHLLECESPVLTNEAVGRLVNLEKQGEQGEQGDFPLKVKSISSNYSLEEGIENGLKRVVKDVEEAVMAGHEIIIITDENLSRDKMYLPSLLITSAAHQNLIRKKMRAKCSLVISSGEIREVHHFAVLLGYGANAVNPYLVFESLDWLIRERIVEESVSREMAKANYLAAVGKGLLKVISKMGISTTRSYTGAQIFEAVGISDEVIEQHFTGTISRINGIGLEEIEKDYLTHFKKAFSMPVKNLADYLPGGDYEWRMRGEKHLFNPETVHLLQHACRTNNAAIFEQYSRKIDQQNQDIFTLRGLLEFTNQKPIPLEEVEPKENIFKRFVTGAMSFGSISWEAHTTLAKAMNRIGGKSNTGEGGEDPVRFNLPLPGEDSLRSAIKQIASGRFGVTANYLINADEVQIKIAQGAKPGEGGQLPGHKVDEVIARVRHSTPGVELISPPPHHDIYSIEDLAQLIYDLKCINPRAKVSVKLVSCSGVGTIAAGVVKAYADTITIAGFDGGTGASPISSIKYAGLPWELGLAETHQTLVLNNLRNRARLQTDGQIKTARDVVIATLLGAEEWGVATTALVVMGCIIMRKCHLNTCPVGIATQREELRKLFDGEVEHLVNFFTFLAEGIRKYMADLGFKTIDEMVGQVAKLKIKSKVNHPKATTINLNNLLYQEKIAKVSEQFCCVAQPNIARANLDYHYIDEIRNGLREKKKVFIQREVKNFHRAVGSIASYEITRLVGEEGLPDDSIKFHLTGSAGQSFAAFACRGMSFLLEGEANDYFAKGLSGAKIVLRFPSDSALDPEENIIVGNVAFYGATSGSAFIGGIGGERFAVRNSGVNIVVEGIGTHGLEYMTGGKVIILGPIGRNFAAGMSGGVAYLYEGEKNHDKVNLGLVDLEPIEELADMHHLKNEITAHAELTGSKKAKAILKNFTEELNNFTKVIPREYKKIIAKNKRQKSKKELVSQIG